ncbi:hypothetical protein [Neptuniibacter pectenicola]|uniref:hypothetical protein n=1 Tax=Neptuniibacter pectenicola TaxID=1806669 RepID=UPI000B3089FF|nr:hypothetical protein [Neptuniibacter pectenicola]
MIEYIYIIALHLLGCRVFMLTLPNGAPITTTHRVIAVIFWPLIVASVFIKQAACNTE